jgi:hypothetical protein
MSRYDERLEEFVRGRRFARMSKPVRNRADVWCDACGSMQARVLFGIRDESSAQVFLLVNTACNSWRHEERLFDRSFV